MKKTPLILIIDDESAILHMLKASLEDEEFLVETLADGSKVLETIGSLVPDLVLLDIFMPQYNGIDLLTKIKTEYPAQDVIMISGFGTISLALETIHKGARNFIEKPFNFEEILSKISFLRDMPKNQEVPVVNNFQDFGITGASSLFCELMNHALLLAPLEEPLIIYGPTGSGKSLIARYVHENSTKKNNDFVTIDCVAFKNINQDILNKTGTLFFKNIHELDQENQKTILAFLDNNKKIRVIASSTPSLFKAVRAGMYNSSLFCKLNATPLEIPSLNKRRYDIPLLAQYFLLQANKKNKNLLSYSPEAIRALRNYQWVGDVAQLKNTIQALASLKDRLSSKIITYEDIEKIVPEHNNNFIEEQQYLRFNSLDQATEAFERRYIFHLLKRYRYDTTQLAEYLKLPVAQLQDKMTKLQISVTGYQNRA